MAVIALPPPAGCSPDRVERGGDRSVKQGLRAVKKPSARPSFSHQASGSQKGLGVVRAQGRHVVWRDHLDAGGYRPDGSWQRAMRPHDEMTRATHVLLEVMMQHRRQATFGEKELIVLVQIMGDEHRAGAMQFVECLHRGEVSTADGI